MAFTNVYIPDITSEEMNINSGFNHVVFFGEPEYMNIFGVKYNHEYRIVKCYCDDEILKNNSNIDELWSVFDSEIYTGEIKHFRNFENHTFRCFKFITYKNLVFDLKGRVIGKIESLFKLMFDTLRVSDTKFWIKFIVPFFVEDKLMESQYYYSSSGEFYNDPLIMVKYLGAWIMALEPHKNAIDYANVIKGEYDLYNQFIGKSLSDKDLEDIFYPKDGDDLDRTYDPVQIWREAFECINWNYYMTHDYDY